MSDWADAQRRMTALGYYTGPIDNDPGEGTLGGVVKLLEIVEKATGRVAPKPLEVQPAVSGNYPLPTGFNPDYSWIGSVGTLPRILQEMINVYGTKETPGEGDSPVILGWAKEVGLEKVYAHDSTAWCGLTAALCVKRSGYVAVAGPLWALNWLNFGVRSDVPSLGDILVFERFDKAGKRIGGHVGLYVGEDGQYYHVLGGNTADSVSIARLLKGRCVGARRPAYKNPLPQWKPYKVSTAGVISENEA